MKKENGFYFGLNEIKSKNIIMPCDEKYQKKNEIIVGKSGGMGFTHKRPGCIYNGIERTLYLRE